MTPLAERMRPKNLGEYIGQAHLAGPDGVLRKAIERGALPSMMLWGPPGVGKTTLAQLIANELKRPFQTLSAISAGVKDVREAIEVAQKQRFFNNASPILFIDEIHRFSKAQQDSLLGAVEKGIITLIGATTENPSFEVIPALLSRCQVYVLEHHNADDLAAILQRALTLDEQLKHLPIVIKEHEAMFHFSGGDARRLLNLLELIVQTRTPGETLVVTNDIVKELAQNNTVWYDKGGEQHYDIISAFIKSMRGSDPNATVYWLARMIEGGEDPMFICRRMVILAAEDIGLANPNALLMAQTCMTACHQIGFPEARIIMSQCAIYLATSPKSNATYMAIDEALALVRKSGSPPVPLHLRNAPTKLMKSLDYGKNYQYAHGFDGNFVFQEFLPDKLAGTSLYHPGSNPAEDSIRQRMKALWGDKYTF